MLLLLFLAVHQPSPARPANLAEICSMKNNRPLALGAGA